MYGKYTKQTDIQSPGRLRCLMNREQIGNLMRHQRIGKVISKLPFHTRKRIPGKASYLVKMLQKFLPVLYPHLPAGTGISGLIALSCIALFALRRVRHTTVFQIAVH